MSQQINLYSPILRRQKKYFSAATMAFSLGVVILGVGALCVYAGMQVTVLDQQSMQTSLRMETDTARLQAMLADKSGETRRKELEARIQEAEEALKARKQINEALKSDSLGNSKGFSPQLNALARQALDGVWLTHIGFEPDNGLNIAGSALRAELVPAYLDRLKREQTLRRYAFGSLEINAAAAPAGQARPPSERSALPAGAVSFRLSPSGAPGPSDTK